MKLRLVWTSSQRLPDIAHAFLSKKAYKGSWTGISMSISRWGWQSCPSIISPCRYRTTSRALPRLPGGHRSSPSTGSYLTGAERLSAFMDPIILYVIISLGFVLLLLQWMKLAELSRKSTDLRPILDTLHILQSDRA